MHRILFYFPHFSIASHKFGGFAVYTYGAVLGVAFLISFWMAVYRARKAGIPSEVFSNLALLLLIAGIIGSRLLFVLEDWQEYSSHPLEIFNLREGGLSIHGGLIFAFFAGWWYARKYKLDFWKTADILAPAIAIGLGIGRIGCFFNGCCAGISTKLPWGVVFDASGYFGRRHPTQLYEMFLDFLIAGIVTVIGNRGKTGIAFLRLCLLVGIERFFMEYLRADAIWMGPFSLVQFLSLLFMLVSGIFLFRRQCQPSALFTSSSAT